MKYMQCLIIILSVLITASLQVRALRAGVSDAASMSGAVYELCEARDMEMEEGEEETEYC